MIRKLWLLLVLVLGILCVGAAFAEDVPVMSHAEYTAAEIDSPVCVETYVQATQSWWDNKITVYAQSPDGAYFIYNAQCTEENAALLTPGTKIRVTGYKSEWAGETEIVDPVLEILEGDTFVAQPFDATSLLGTEDLIGHQNELVSFTGLTVEPQEDGSAFSYKDPVNQTDDLYLTVSKDGKVYNFCVEYYLRGKDTEVYRAVEGLQAGDVIDVEAFLYWYNGVNPHCVRVTKAEGPEPEIVASGECGENAAWTLDSEGLLTVSGTGEMTDHPWTAAEVKRVVIEEGVTSICDGAFEECGSLESISIADTVTAIGRYAFQRCASLTEIDLPAGVTAVGDNTFTHCIALTGVTIPESVTSLGSYAFAYCTELKELVLPDSLKIIGDSCFECTPLETVNIPDGVTGIGRYTFFESALTQATVPDGVTSIGPCAFGFCSSLTSVTLPDSLTSIADTAFQACALTDVYYAGTEEQWAAIEIGEENAPLTGANIHFNADGPAAPEIIASGECGENLTWTLDVDGLLTVSGTGAIPDFEWEGSPWIDYRESVTAAVIESGITGIGENAFAGCGNLAAVTLPDGITSIGADAFYSCGGLTGIVLPDSLTVLGENAFFDCISLTGIGIPANVAEIGRNVFGYCESLESITVDESNSHYASYEGALFDKEMQTLITCPAGKNGTYRIPSGVLSIEDAFFECTKLTEIMIPESVNYISAFDFSGCSSLTAFTVDEGNPNYDDADGVLYDKSMETLIACPQGRSGICEIPDGVVSIASNAFRYCGKITGIVIPERVESIGDWAFSACGSLTDIALPESLTRISSGLFSHCSGLENISIPEGVTEIGSDAFYDCGNLRSITIPAGVTEIGEQTFMDCFSLTNVILPEGITRLGFNAFCECTNLRSITIPVSLTDIGVQAFISCYNLSDVYYAGTEEQWSAVAIAERNEPLAEAEIHYNATGPAAIVASGTCGENLTWTLDEDGLLTISGTGTISGSSWPSSDVKRVVMEEGVTGTGSYTFAGCSSLEEVVFPESLTNIGAGAFISCGGLTEITIPAGVTEIGDNAFDSCASLTAFTVAEGNEAYASADGVLFSADGTELILYPIGKDSSSYEIPAGVTAIGKGAFYGCTNLQSVTIPEGVTAIGQAAFSNCRSLASVTLPESMTRFEYGVFSSCSALTEITIPANTNYLDDAAFSGCTGLTTLTILNTSPVMGPFTLDGCTGLTDIWFAGTEEKWNGYNFQTGATVHCNYVPPVASGTCGENATWTLDGEGLLTISGTGKTTDRYPWDDAPWADYQESVTSAVVESGITGIGGRTFVGCSNLTAVSLQDGVTRISGSAFENCSSLVSIALPDSLTEISSSAFAGCSSLTEITIPAGVTDIGVLAFESCGSLTGIFVSGDNTMYSSVDGVLYNKEQTQLLAFPGGKTTADKIPDTVVSIGEYSFMGCSNLVSIILPPGVNSFSVAAFKNCTNLKEIVIPDGTRIFEDAVFSGCSSLARIFLPASITDIMTEVFKSCDSLTDVYYGGTQEQWNAVYISSRNEALVNAAIHYNASGIPVIIASGTCGKNLTWTLDSEGLLTISGTGAMENWNGPMPAIPWGTDITAVLIKEGVTSIGDNAFLRCSSLSEITIPDGMESIGRSAFYGCSSLSSITLPAGITSVGEWCFEGCSSLTDVTLPEGVTGIASYTFDRCTSLVSINIPASVTSIQTSAFDNCQNLKAVNVSPENTTYRSIDGVLFNEDASILLYYPDMEATSYTIPEGVKTIAKRVFQYHSNLAGVTLPDGLITIDEGAFSFCSSLAGVTLPDSLQTIGYEAFLNCALTEIEIPASTTNVATLAFEMCGRLESIEVSPDNPAYSSADGVLFTKDGGTLITLPCGKGPFYMVPDGTKYIESFAFNWCAKLTDLSVPDSILRTGYNLYTGCRNLKNVYFAGTEEKWSTFDNNWDAYSNPAIHCYDPLPADTLVLPADLMCIQSEAFAGLSEAEAVLVPASVTQIADDAFNGSDLVLLVPAGSFAETWAKEHAIPCVNK